MYDCSGRSCHMSVSGGMGNRRWCAWRSGEGERIGKPRIFSPPRPALLHPSFPFRIISAPQKARTVQHGRRPNLGKRHGAAARWQEQRANESGAVPKSLAHFTCWTGVWEEAGIGRAAPHAAVCCVSVLKGWPILFLAQEQQRPLQPAHRRRGPCISRPSVKTHILSTSRYSVCPRWPMAPVPLSREN